MRRGPKGKSPTEKALAGTDQPCRSVVELFPKAPGAAYADPDVPPGLTKAVRDIWDRKVARYRERGQAVRGCEDALKQYCQLEADLDKLRKGKVSIPVSMIREHRTYAAEFYDTPASRKIPAANPRTAENPFLKNLNRNGGS